CTVTVQVVRRNVQDGRDIRLEFLNGFKLEAGDFQNIEAISGGLPGQRDPRRADVAAYQRLVSALGQNLSRQRGGGGLSVGAGNGNDAAFKKAARQFNLANDRYTQSARLLKLGLVGRDTGADHDQVLIAEGALAVAAGLDRDAPIQQERNFILQLGFSLGIG